MKNLKLKVWVNNRLDQEKDVSITKLVKEYKESDFEFHGAKDLGFIYWLGLEKGYAWETSENVEGNPVWDGIYDLLYSDGASPTGEGE